MTKEYSLYLLDEQKCTLQNTGHLCTSGEGLHITELLKHAAGADSAKFPFPFHGNRGKKKKKKKEEMLNTKLVDFFIIIFFFILDCLI